MLTDAIMQAIEDGRTLRAVVNGIAYSTEQIKAREHLKVKMDAPKTVKSITANIVRKTAN